MATKAGTARKKATQNRIEGRRGVTIMAYSPNNEIERALGGFRHKETKAQFEYRDNDTGMFPEFPHQVYLTNGEMRFARRVWINHRKVAH